MHLTNTHSVVLGYLLWIFGFLGSHRFYYGKPITGTIWFFTLGLFFYRMDYRSVPDSGHGPGGGCPLSGGSHQL